MGVEFLAKNIIKLNSGEIPKETFMRVLGEQFNLVKENVVDWASKFIQIYPEK